MIYKNQFKTWWSLLPFTKSIIENISEKLSNITWILLGKDAQNFKKHIKNNNVIEAPHPVSYIYSGDKNYTKLKDMFKILNFIK